MGIIKSPPRIQEVCVCDVGSIVSRVGKEDAANIIKRWRQKEKDRGKNQINQEAVSEQERNGKKERERAKEREREKESEKANYKKRFYRGSRERRGKTI